MSGPVTCDRLRKCSLMTESDGLPDDGHGYDGLDTGPALTLRTYNSNSTELTGETSYLENFTELDIDIASFLPAKSKFRQTTYGEKKYTCGAETSRSCRNRGVAHLFKSSNMCESFVYVNFVIAVVLSVLCCCGALTFAEASPPFPIERPQEKADGLDKVDDLCKRLKIQCLHGSCINDTRPRCECDQGWIGSTCNMCGGRMKLTEPTGYIIDGYTNYTTNNKCTWLVEAPSVDDDIRLRFLHFATECSWDHLYMYNGQSVFDPQVAAYSGLVIPQGSSSDVMPEVVMKGYAYLHFYSDAAYNMSGFNISYTIGPSCPLECSGQGDCDLGSGDCSCHEGWVGEGCNIPACPNNCSYPNGQCASSGGICDCNNGTGYDCSIPLNEGHWERAKVTATSKVTSPSPRSSHKTVVHGNYMYAFYGFDFNNKPNDEVVRLDLTTLEWKTIVPGADGPKPAARYGHTVVTYKAIAYMYGGQLIETGHITDELWLYNLTQNTWSRKEIESDVNLAVVGHLAHVIEDVMYILCGHNPVLGYTNTVQELNLTSMVWTKPQTIGALVLGGYGQTSVYYQKTNMIYVHGGYVSNSSSTYQLTDELYSYEPRTRVWGILASSGLPKFLHSAVMLNGMMYVFGGNTHNDTSISMGAKCFSTNFMAYDPYCNKWMELAPPLLHDDISRFGHSAEMYNDQMYMFAGFNGQVLSDVYIYTPGSCGAHKTKRACLESGAGPVCVWTKTDSCMDRRQEVLREEQNTCPPTDPGEARDKCGRYTSCRSCAEATHYDCVWCGKECVYSSDATNTCSKTPVVSSSNECPVNASGSQCGGVHNCNACNAINHCRWSSTACIDSFSLTTEETKCNKPCSMYTNCENCTGGSCMWCGNENRCVESISYVASFPYGQCLEWTTQNNVCPATKCSGLRTCEECQMSPACGWCDDGSDTGLGQCMEGSLSGPVSNKNIDLAKCPAERWFFDSCPVCQCNGHSQCKNGTDICEKCEDNTIGEHCEMCEDGFYGTATNGGNCSVCECNGQADTCNHQTGVCFCHTRGVKGDHCDLCDETNKYYGDPKNGGTCYYALSTNYKFTFNLSEDKEDSKHQTHINFMNEPPDPERDVDFSINCSSDKALMNITIRTKGEEEETLVENMGCQMFEQKFVHTQYAFGDGTNTTFYVYVYNFQTPFVVEISFLQIDPIDLIHFFITFFSCFLSLLLIAAVVWKVKQKCDMYRRRQRMVVEMEQMASRPFGTCTLDLPKALDEPFIRQEAINAMNTAIISANPRASQRLKKAAQARYSPSPIALEPMSGNKAAILSLFVRLPTGDEEYTPADQQGMVVGSALVTIGSHRKNSTEAQQRTDKNAKHRKQVGGDHDSNCV